VSGELTWPLAAGVLGLLVGTFASACIDRLPREGPFGASLLRCRTCGTRSRLGDLIPIVGWLMRDGRCRACRTRESGQAAGVEAGNALLWAALVVLYGPTVQAAVLMALVTALLILSLIDLRHYLLPDVITLPGIVAGVAATWLPDWPVTLLDSALTAAVGYFAMMAFAKAAEMYYGEEAVGQGDWKMVAMLGAFLGATPLIIVVVIANGVGAVVGLLMVALMGREGRQKLPLGTFLGFAGILMVLIDTAKR
jgi:leader peptidase (prepilin peptidase)/N-methyltransferase